MWKYSTVHPEVQDPPRNSTIVASPKTSNQRVIVEPNYSLVLQPQAIPVNLEDSYDRMCGGIQAPIRNGDQVKDLTNDVEVACGTDNHSKYS